ncbi:MAG: tetratricopeptide repeat protein [Lachnospiraceae bacterium]|nr:tetratricopeptide repeat protein [Lachnospiraceae bacterium]
MKKSARSIIAGLLVMCSLSGCGFSLPFFETEETPADAGMTLLNSREYREALERFRTAAAQGESGAALYRGMGIADYHLGEYAAAEEAFGKALAACKGVPNDLAFDVSYYLAETYRTQGKEAEAIGVYDAILALRPGEEDAHYLRGLAWLKQGDHEKAAEDFRTVTERRPLQYDRVFSIYEALSEAGYAPEGVQMLTDILAENGESMTNYERGRFAWYIGSKEDAKSWLDEAYNDSSIRTADKIPIVILLGQVAQELGDDTYAISVYRRFLQEDQSQASIYNALGVCEMRMGSYSDALSDFQIGLGLDDAEQNPALLRNIVAACEYMGNFVMAAQRMADYLELMPTDEEARRENIFLTTRVTQSQTETEGE